MRTILRAAVAVLTMGACALAVLPRERPAAACGGCFHEPPQPAEVESVVTDHRMVFSLGRTQTVLWDQIRYSGDPRRFAWVLPIHPGARIELSHDAFIAALDASTQTVITGPVRVCRNGTTRSYGGGGGGGCGGSSTSSLSASADPTGSEGPVDAGFTGSDQVTVVSQSVVGPYETVTLRSTDGEALDAWLVQNGFAVPPSIQPTIDAYTREGFDFIALKLEPNAGIRAMQPVRIVIPGTDPSLPLRMVAAGIGSHVGLSLYVISEGRFHPQNFPDVSIPFDQLTWDAKAARSNYQELATAALASGGSRGWLTEHSDRPLLTQTGIGPGFGGSSANPGLADAYFGLCRSQPPKWVPLPCTAHDAGPPPDAGAPADANAPDAPPEGGDASTDGGPADAAAQDAAVADAGCGVTEPACDSFDDIEVATKGMQPSDVRVTRLRAFLPADAVAAGDLRLEPTAVQSAAPSLHHTDNFSDPKFDPCAGATGASPSTSSSSGGFGCLCTTTAGDGGRAGDYFTAGVLAFLGLAIARRRRRREG